MANTKSVDYHATNILQLHVDLHKLPPQHPDYEKIEDQLSRQRTAWVNKLDFNVRVAQNEKSPWTDEELGLVTIPMEKKAASGHPQTGDYIFEILNDDQSITTGGLCVERKGVTRWSGRMVGCDLYSTFSKKDNRRRFEAEFKRFQKDPRFNLFVLIAECSYLEYLSFKPKFNGKNYNKTNYGMNVAARRATIAKLISMGVVVHFAGTRRAAVELYSDLVVQWCRTHYTQILNI
ncbi:MAG: hypothetical protein KAQ85_00270 [Thermodesulfovibrionia bacterium]|nr:hypothetical protein [Thermodesulfovibrionia bacterium]